MGTQELLKEIENRVRAAKERGVKDPNAMCLSTVSLSGRPSSRIVLFKGIENDGISFYTNYNGRKGLEIAENPAVALTLFWSDVDQQVRVEGSAEKLSRDHAEKYFATRPRESQIGAWASQQSTEINSRLELEERVKHYSEKFEGIPVPCPQYWGGYTVQPTCIEFWQGRPGRLHDRIVYSKKESSWVESRLSP